ncbi:MAG: tyrosine--tRNA ligase [Candidatus Nanogingivalaceae bacterium]|nr:tyrosine--tRNA ligase [Candidatus Nanogingivalaceae bacterium]
MTLAEELSWRGLINQTTFANIKDINEPRTFYFGVDPSAPSMTIGNLAAMMLCRHFIDHGHKPLLLVGGATGMIGDPDGKKQERDLRNAETVARNVKGLATQFRQVFRGQDFEIVDNADWFAHMNYIDFLHKVGKHISMTQLLDREFVQQRIGEGGAGISYGEFSYALIQGYDFLHLYREKDATLQLAGADQWGNSVLGVSLIRKLEGGEAHVLTAPLVINKQTGVKFGKSEGGAIWLDPEMTSPYKFYQFWLNCDDETSEDLIKIYTLLDRETVEALIDNHRANPGERALQKTLAREVTDIVHGRQRRESVERVTGVLFGGGDIAALNDEDLNALANEIPTVDLDTTVIAALVDAGICASNGEAKRLIKSGAISVNGSKIAGDMPLTEISLLKKGKNNFVLVR